MIITFDLLQTAAVAAVLFLLGQFIKSKIKFFQTYFIPAPVIGGLLFSILMFIGIKTGTFEIKLTNTLQDFFMNIFFTCTGFTCSFSVIRKSGKLGAILAIVAVSLLFFQNLLGAGLAHLFGLHALHGVAMGSISMSGGVGSAAAFGPTLEEFGADGGMTIGIAAATFGLLLGSLIGGPVAKRLIGKYNLTADSAENRDDRNNSQSVLNGKNLLHSTIMILVAALIGSYISKLLNLTGLTFPYYVGCLFGGALIRNLADLDLLKLRMKEIDIIGDISLNLFLSMVLMALNINKLLDLALPMVIILLSQAALMMLWAYYITFFTMGRNYDAAVMAAGHCGVGLGQTPNAMANMSAIIEKNGPAPTAWFVLPVITVVFINICNPIIITLFINLFK
ncbi:sodium/glutamate symporter [Necropsobacter massiliensis]|uniref:sodium/glutamate symporter n=1 Tax=Necropsobacter massiliensis TaxID=1400001 RepID=UPI000595A5F9|nr:sodium/glutamate symporter [Necropsobacter massiliensis]